MQTSWTLHTAIECCTCRTEWGYRLFIQAQLRGSPSSLHARMDTFPRPRAVRIIDPICRSLLGSRRWGLCIQRHGFIRSVVLIVNSHYQSARLEAHTSTLASSLELIRLIM